MFDGDSQAEIAVYCGMSSGLKPGTAFWLDIEENPAPEFQWPDCKTSNEILLEMIATLWKFSDVAGVYTNAYEWGKV